MGNLFIAIFMEIGESLCYVKNDLLPPMPIQIKLMGFLENPFNQRPIRHVLINKKSMRSLSTKPNQPYQVEMMNTANCLDLS